MKKILYVLSLIIVFAFYSCTDESTFNNPVHFELENGAFIQFENVTMAPTYEDAQNILFEARLNDANNNTASYSLTLKVVSSGITYIAENYFTATSFPAQLSITSQNMADAIGVDVNSFGFGDAFSFIATATRNDGTVFTGIEPSFNEDDLTIGPGNTEGQLLSVPAYRSAMNFGTIISCPFVQADMIGTYTIINDSGFSVTGATTFEVIAGTLPSQVILVNPFDSSANYNIVVDVNPFGIATMERQNAFLTEEVCCAGYTPTSIATDPGLTSLALSCIGYLELNVRNFIGLAGSNGTGFAFGGLTQLSAQKN